MAFSSSSKTLRFAVRSCACAMALAAGRSRAETMDASPLSLDRVEVLGSHVRGVGVEGATPVRVYDRDFIEATGVLRLADFLNLLPQNYTGASSGRSGAPNDFNPEFGVRTENTVPPINFILGAADVPLGQSGVSGANLRGLGSGSTLVLVDGRRRPIAGQGNRGTDSRQGFVDLNTIPLGMIERVEVLADGASALYGSDAIGGVINVVLKKNYTGAEVATTYRGTFDGGARERRATFNAGVTAENGRLRGTVSIDLYDRAPLNAAQRDFSANQDHTAVTIGHDADGAPQYGRDLRLNWGYPAIVQARGGWLAGVTAPDGSPTSLALVPEGASSVPPAGGFIGATESDDGPTGLRRANTARYLSLVTPQESQAVAGSLEYDLSRVLRVYAGFSDADVRGEFDAQPPVSSASSFTGFGLFSTVVPATIGGQPNALNPFGQDVMIGLVHEEFGPMRQTTHTRNRGAFAGLSGATNGGWNWDASVSWQRERFTQRNVTFDGARFTQALAAADPARRFNPFVDARAAGPVNAAIYPSLAAIATYRANSELTVGSFVTDGPAFRLPGPGGEVQVAAGGEWAHARHRVSTTAATGGFGDARAQRHSYAAFVELLAPLVDSSRARAGLRRLDLQLAGRHEDHGPAGRSTDPKVGVLWSPAKAVDVRAGYATGFRVPTLTEYETPETTAKFTVVDPRRTPASTPGVAVLRGSSPAAKPETSTNEFYGVVFRPGAAPGWSLSADYHRVRQRDVLQYLPYQAIVNQEAVFAGRVTRAMPAAADTALGQPGAITAVDARFVNFGAIDSDELDLALDYDLPARALGRFRFHVSGTHVLGMRTELRPGAAVDLEGDTGAPQRWRWIGLAAWSRGRWSASVLADHVGGFASNDAGNQQATQGSGSMTVVNVNAGYVFERGVGRGFARGARIGIGVGNLFDRAPPFSDTIFGYNGGLHSPLGRTYELSFSVPL